MYRLFSRVPEGLNPIANIVRQHIEHMGNEIINRREAKLEAGGEKDTNQDPAFVKELLALHDKVGCCPPPPLPLDRYSSINLS